MNLATDSQPATAEFHAVLKRCAADIEQRYRTLTPTSARLAEVARDLLPGGCARQGVFRRPYPTYVLEAQGSTMTDVDGRRLVDFCFNATALPVGHAHPSVIAAVSRQLVRGTAYFSPTSLEMDLAAEIRRRLPSAERVLFTNSGSEAVLMALRIARACTGRTLVAKFEGAFHGNYDDVLWSVGGRRSEVGPPTAPAAVAASEGLLPPDDRTLILPYNDAPSTVRLIETHAERLAAVIVEPLSNRMGLVQPTPVFLRALRDVCSQHRILLVFDEVLCFRAGYHGMQGRLGISPDLTVLGKIIGGGFPVGAVTGFAEVMDAVDPRRSRVYHTGTFAANPVTLTAGLATLELLTPSTFDDLEAAGEFIRQRLQQICRGLPLQISGIGSLFKVSATAEPLTDYRATLTCDLEWQQLASLALSNDGIFFNPQLNGCVATTTTTEQIEVFLHAFASIISMAPGRP